MSGSITSIRPLCTVSKSLLYRLFLIAGLLVGLSGGSKAVAQKISSHYLSKLQEDGTIYHALPVELFKSSEHGELRYDVTYKERRDGLVTLNFTYEMAEATPIDSITLQSGRVVMGGKPSKLYIEPTKGGWKHRYSVRFPFQQMALFYDGQATPVVTLHAQQRHFSYAVKRSAWREYAPIGYKIFEMIRINEAAQ